MIVDIRTVQINGVSYVRTEDVAKYLRELGAAEVTDVRNRVEAAAAAFDKPVIVR